MLSNTLQGLVDEFSIGPIFPFTANSNFCRESLLRIACQMHKEQHYNYGEVRIAIIFALYQQVPDQSFRNKIAKFAGSYIEKIKKIHRIFNVYSI